jgi:hypothetical protein
VADREPPPSPAQAALEDELRELGRHLDLPEPRGYAPAVLARLAVLTEAATDGGSRAPEPWWRTALARRRRIRRAVAAAALAGIAVFAVTPVGQAAVGRVVHLAGVVLRFDAADAPRRPEQLPGETGTALAAARRQVRFPVTVPGGLGAPDDVTVSDSGRVVSLIYRAAPGRPTPGPGGISARLDEFAGDLDLAFTKQIGADAAVEFIDLGGGVFAVWIPSPHAVTYVDGQGTLRTESAHLAERTLIWQAGSVSFRLEGSFTQDQAVAIARTALQPGTG